MKKAIIALSVLIIIGLLSCGKKGVEPAPLDNKPNSPTITVSTILNTNSNIYDIAINTGGELHIVTSSDLSKLSTSGIITPLGTVSLYPSTGLFTIPATMYGICFDAANNMYLASPYSKQIIKITNPFTLSILAGSGNPGSINGKGLLARFDQPVRLATDAVGNIYIADWLVFRVRKVSPTGEVTDVAGSNTKGTADGQGVAASFTQIRDIAIGASGNLYVVDGNRIRKITPDGTVTTIAGSVLTGSTDGIAANARFNFPQGIAVDAAENIYVADFSNNKIRKITSDGVVSTFAGNGEAGLVDGPVASAVIGLPTALVLDAAKNIYVVSAISTGSVVRKITINK